eukprot:scaffold3100_cov110-Isochrysis_galbana.AAC.2
MPRLSVLEGRHAHPALGKKPVHTSEHFPLAALDVHLDVQEIRGRHPPAVREGIEGGGVCNDGVQSGLALARASNHAHLQAHPGGGDGGADSAGVHRQLPREGARVWPLCCRLPELLSLVRVGLKRVDMSAAAKAAD